MYSNTMLTSVRVKNIMQTITVLKTLVVWHRCLRSGDNTFTELCAPYANSILSLNNFTDKSRTFSSFCRFFHVPATAANYHCFDANLSV